MKNLNLEILQKMLPFATVKDVGEGQLHWVTANGVECSITEFSSQDLPNAKEMAGHANDITFCGNFRFSATN